MSNDWKLHKFKKKTSSFMLFVKCQFWNMCFLGFYGNLLTILVLSKMGKQIKNLNIIFVLAENITTIGWSVVGSGTPSINIYYIL